MSMRPLLIALLFAIPVSSGAQSTADGVALFESRRYAEARSTLEAAAKADPKDARAAYYLGRIALVDGDAGKAEDWLEHAVKLDGRKADYHHWLGRAYSREALRAGKFRQMKLVGRIKDEFHTAVALDPDDVDARYDLMQLYLVVPGIMGGSEDKAREEAAEIRKRNAFRGHLAAGAIADRKKDAAGAEREFVAATTAFPDSLEGFYALGSHYARRGEWERAFAICDRLISERDDGVSKYYYGRMSSMSGQHLDRGAELLRQYLQRRPDDIDPSLASAHYRLGLIYEKQGKRDLAKQEFATTVQLDPKQTEAKEGLKRVQ
jgi:tetratricopeptide (TPR) repeat protein